MCETHLPFQGRLNVRVYTAPKGATIYGGAVERSETEGEHLAALASSELFPFQLLITFAVTFPVNGDSFWVCDTMCQFSFSLHRPQDALNCAMSPANLVARGPGREVNIKYHKNKQHAFACCLLLWYPAATYLPGPSPAKYCRRTRA